MDNPPNSFTEEDAYTEDEFISKTIYVGDLSSEITEKEVTEYCLEFGSVASVAIKKTGSKHAPWSHAFVTFEKSESAAKALALGKHEILSRRVVVKAADSWDQPKEKDAKCKRTKVSRDETIEMKCLLLNLNDDCLCHIASYLKLRDLLNLSKTCKRLERVLEPIFASYKRLEIKSLRGLTRMTIREILYKISPHVQHIVCSENFDLNEKCLEELSKNYCVTANIVSLDCRLPWPLFNRVIGTFKNLETFKCPITDDMSAELSNCKNLQYLDLYKSTHVTGKHLDKLSNLQHLNLLGCSNLRPEFFKNLCMKTKLVTLNIEECGRLDSSSIETLASTQTKLEKLSISTNYKTANILRLATLKNLKKLRIDCSSENCVEFFQELAKHRGGELEVLEIWECLFNQQVEQIIYSLKKLEVLAVYCCKNMTSMFFTKMAKSSLECLFIQPSISMVEEGVLNLISKSETIKVIAIGGDWRLDKRRLVLSAYELIKKKERKYPLSLFTKGPCIIDGIFHEKPVLGPQRDFLKQTKKLGYLGPLPWWFDYDICLC